MSKDFAHLHLHTIFSLLDGIIRPNELAKYVRQHGMTSVAQTDHGNLHGSVEFYKACKKENVRPILGCEVYLTNDPDGIENNKLKTKDNHHCVLLARNNAGFSTLIELVNKATLNNFYYKPRVSLENLKAADTSNLYCLSACLGGLLSKRGKFDKENKAFGDPESQVIERLNLFKDLFQGRFYAEIQDNPEFWEQEAFNNFIIPLARQEDVPLIITADAHFLRAEDKQLHNLVMAQQMKKTLDELTCDEDGLYYGDGVYVRSPEDMFQSALKYGAEESFWNTLEISKDCEVEITLGEYENPHFDITKEDDYEEFLVEYNNRRRV